MSLFSLNWIYKLNRHTSTPLNDVQSIISVHLRLALQRWSRAESTERDSPVVEREGRARGTGEKSGVQAAAVAERRDGTYCSQRENECRL